MTFFHLHADDSAAAPAVASTSVVRIVPAQRPTAARPRTQRSMAANGGAWTEF
jgi:hypothetical protein